MAVYQGARQPSIVLPGRPRIGIAAPTLPRRRVRAAVRARRGPSRLAAVLAAIVIAFTCAFFSLAQDVRVSATGYEVDRLAAEHAQLDSLAADLHNELNRLGKAPAIRKLALQSGLGPLPQPVVLPAR